MKPITLLLCLSFCYHANGKDYLDYYRSINKAEYHLVHEQPDSALFYYDRAFAEYDFVFPIDAFIAAQFAWKHKNSEKTVAYLLKGAGSGLRSSCLEQSPILLDFENTPAYEKVYNGMRQENARFARKTDEDMKQDWVARAGEQGLAKDEDETAFMDVISKNVKKLKELMAAGKYPGEMLIGLSDNCKDMSNYNAYNALASYPCVITELHDPLWNAVKNGQLHPRDFASLWEEELRLNKPCPGMKPKVRHFNIHLDQTRFAADELNRDRAAYAIGTLETDEMKEKLEQEQGYIFFLGHK